LLRISGAIQVLEEMLTSENGAAVLEDEAAVSEVEVS
jgi:hypothetical protein